MTDVQLKYINDGNKHFQLHKPSHSTKQKLISAKILYIITLLDFGLSEAQIDQTGFSSATISYVHSQLHCNLPKASGDDPSMPRPIAQAHVDDLIAWWNRSASVTLYLCG
jgi:hypothetical protein